MKIEKLVIERSRWLRGRDPGALLRDGKMCCLGFLAKTCGADDKDIENLHSPVDVPHLDWPDGFIEKRSARNFDGTEYCLFDSSVCLDLQSRNDDPCGDESDREAEIKRLFSKLDIEVEFID